MTAFFVGWALWEDMTFVLACCIVLVFAIGLGKLWWANRALRRLEIVDEEKRARVSVMAHCGIENMRPPEIPFGIRAIQSGIEVDGIWIARHESFHAEEQRECRRHIVPSPRGIKFFLSQRSHITHWISIANSDHVQIAAATPWDAEINFASLPVNGVSLNYQYDQ